MATLTADKSRNFSTAHEERDILPVTGSINLYMGEAVGLTSGYLVTATASTSFEGFMAAGVSTTACVNGEKEAEVRTKGRVLLTVTGASTSAQNGTAVYLTDGNTFTTVTTGLYIGNIVTVPATGTANVFFLGNSLRTGAKV